MSYACSLVARARVAQHLTPRGRGLAAWARLDARSPLAARSRGLSSRSPYDILGVRPGASESEIKNAYRKQALKYHPDRNPDASSSAKFQEVSNAYAQLSSKGGGGGGGGGYAEQPGAGFGGGGFSRQQYPFGATGGFGRSGRFGGRSGFSASDAEARRQFEQLFGNLEHILREMERQRAGGGFADSRFGARSTSVRQEVVRRADGRTVLRTTTTTIGADGAHRIETSEQELPAGAGFGGFGGGPFARAAGFGGFGGPAGEPGRQFGAGEPRERPRSAQEETAWRREQAARQAAAQQAAQQAASTLTSVLWGALKASVVRAVRKRVDPIVQPIVRGVQRLFGSGKAKEKDD